MSSQVVESVYLGHDNTIDLRLTADGQAADLSSVTKMAVKIGTISISSDDYPAAFDWSSGGSEGVVTLSLADALSSEAVQAGIYQAVLVVYDLTNPDGIVWGDGFLLRVVE